MVRKSWLIIMAILLLLGGAVFAQLDSKNPIRVAAIIPLSGGAFAEAGQEMRMGYLMAQSEINNSGGILGRKLELIIEDDQCKPETGIAAYMRLLTRGNITAFVGGYSSTITYAQCNAVRNVEPLMVWIGASSTTVEHSFGQKKWFFHMHPWDYHRQSTVTAFLESINPKPKTIALTYEDGIYGTTSADYFKKYAKEAGFTIVLDEPHKSGSSDFTSLLTKAKALKPDIFYDVSYAGDYILQIKQAKEIGFNPKAFVIVAPMFPNYVESLGDIGDYVVGVNPWAPSLKLEGLDEWKERFASLYPEKKSYEYWLPLAYTNLITVAEGIKKAGSTDKEKIIAALEQLDIVTPFGRMKFEPSEEGGLHQCFTDLVMVQWQKQQPIVVFPKDIAGAAFVYPKPNF